MNINICKQSPKQCKTCKDELLGDELGYHNIGYCSIGCMLISIDHRLAIVESKLKKENKRNDNRQR